jgi:hypothetical protein
MMTVLPKSQIPPIFSLTLFMGEDYKFNMIDRWLEKSFFTASPKTVRA